MIIALPLVCRGKITLSRSVISPSCASSLVIPAAASVFCRLAISASEQMPNAKQWFQDGRHQLLRRPQTAQSIRNRDDTQRKDNRRCQLQRKRKPSFAPVPPAPRKVCVPVTCPNDPLSTVKSKTRHQPSLPENTPEKKIMVRKTPSLYPDLFCIKRHGRPVHLLRHSDPRIFLMMCWL